MTIDRRKLLIGAGAGAVALPLAAALPGTASADPTTRGRAVLTGAQQQASAGWSVLKGQKVGVITNPTGVLDDLTSIVDAMHAAGVNVVGVFGPEHGFRGTAQAGDAEGTSVDPRTGITVYDAYGANVDKMAAMAPCCRRGGARRVRSRSSARRSSTTGGRRP